MAETRLTNVIIPEVFSQYTLEMTVQKSLFHRAGIISVNPAIPGYLTGGGRTFNLPFWKDSAPADEIPSETVAQTINPITSGAQIAVRQVRQIAWGANDLSALLAGDDPMDAIAQRVATAWAVRLQANLIATSQGVIADNVANDSSDLVNDIAEESIAAQTAASRISPEAIINTAFLMGDQTNKFTAIAVHSAIYQSMSKQNLITFEPTSGQNLGFGTYLGMSVVVDDGLPVVAGSTDGNKYWCYLYEPGAFQSGFSGANIEETEVDRDPSKGAGVDVLYTRRQFALHPVGTAYISPSIAGEFPVNTELDDALSWDRRYEKKNIGFVVLIVNDG